MRQGMRLDKFHIKSDTTGRYTKLQGTGFWHMTIYTYIYNILDSKSGTNDHPIRPFDTRICGGEIWTSQLCFYRVKPPNYIVQMEVKKYIGHERASYKAVRHDDLSG